MNFMHLAFDVNGETSASVSFIADIYQKWAWSNV